MSATQTPRSLQSLTPAQLLALNHAAGDWHVRRLLPDWTGADERALNAWLAEDALHAQALARIAQTWQDAQALQQMFPASYSAGQTAAPDVRAKPAASARPPRQATAQGASLGWRWGWPAQALLASLLLLVIAGMGWQHWCNTAYYSLAAATGTGELRNLALPDGSQVALNANSRLQVHYYPYRRETVLDKGEAFFKVAPDANKPFTVTSGHSEVRVVGTAFNVRAAPPEVVVQVQEGRVALRSTLPGSPQPVTLTAGMAMALEPARGHYRQLAVKADEMAEWRTGQVYFQRRPLAQVAQELARYLDAPVVVADPAIRAIPISGLLALADPERFLLALPSVADVRVQRLPEGGWRIRRQ
ncbi:FecR domain-containing protein [Comamonas sp.]|uniref:FecR family protein n=1 Tax=Comamonas sp. TaxID=34028 RepID=UPI0028A1DB13|nr:FecR domain-containing protein [Comamonas sp.]